MFDGSCSQMHTGTNMAVIGVTVVSARIHWDRAALKRSDASIRHTRVVQIFVTCSYFCAVARREGQRWIDAAPLQTYVLSETIRVFVHSVQTNRYLPINGPIQVGGNAFVSELTALSRERKKRLKDSFLSHAIHDTTASAPSKNHRIGSF